MKNIHDILVEFSQEIRQLFGDKLTKIILYGSYARGEQRENSDVDIMILADIAPEEVSYYADKTFDIAYEFELRFQIEINPNIQRIKVYDKWKTAYPFFMSIEKDGIAV